MKNLLLLSVVLCLLNSNEVYSEDDYYFSSFGQKSLSSLGLDFYKKNEGFVNSSQYLDVYLNDSYVGTYPLFLYKNSHGKVVPCFEDEVFIDGNINIKKLERNENNCINIESSIKGSSVELDFSSLEVRVTVPDVYIKNEAMEYVYYDYGVDGFKSEYSINSYYRESKKDLNSFLSFNSTLNYGKWRINNFSTATLKSSGERDWSSIRTFLSREIRSLRSQIRVGDNFTSGNLFSSINFRGVTIESDSRFLPDSLKGYAPVIRGIAITKSVVTVRQNGYVIYEKSVFPGEFIIDELNDTSYGGDLLVTILGSDGQTQEFVVPYNSSQNLLRPGQLSYSATLGEVRNNDNYNPLFGELVLKRGNTNYLTTYGGIQLAEGSIYKSVLLGNAFSIPLGVISLDATYAKASDTDGELEGYSFRGNYRKNFQSIGSQFNIEVYPYIDKNYFSLSSFLNDERFTYFKDKTRVNFSFSQVLPEQYGILNFNASYSDRWNSHSKNESYRVSYNNKLAAINYSLSASQQEYLSGKRDDQINLVFSFPLGGSNSTSATSGLTFSEDREPSLTLGIYGGDDDLSYQVNFDKGDSSDQFNTSLAKRNNFSNINVNYSYDNSESSIGVNINGGVVVHGNGVVFSPNLGETIGLSYIEDGEGSEVNGNKVNRNGYAVVPNLIPYRENVISVSPNDQSLDLEVKRPMRKLTPALGAISKINFETRHKYTLLINIDELNDEKIPLGALVYNEYGVEVGSVGQNNRILARVEDKIGALHIGFGEYVFCEFKYSEKDVKENEISYLYKECI